MTEEREDVLLIGGTGFIGTELARTFVGDGRKVISIGRHEKSNHPGRVQVLDMYDQEAVQKFLPAAQSVFILTGQNTKNFDPIQELKNLEGIVTVLNDRQPKKVFYLSSVLVYGETSVPAREQDACRPIDQYSQFKLRAEALFKEKLSKDILLGILRVSNVYGNPANRGFIHWLLQAVKEGKEFILNGEGMQERDYIFIDDVVTALVQIEQLLKQSDTINVATGRSYSLNDVIREMSAVAGIQVALTVNHETISEVQRSLVDVSKLHDEYGIVLAHDLRSGLKQTLKSYSLFV
ncbi:MAG: NAD-dependent epimerase/dehydratase family protein [Candidatus Moraniibacteriota bacterium]|nr:MAG: NAD-dependent epimerase/dehydratase family protein [Candidatus Moranbacteria bacterium]